MQLSVRVGDDRTRNGRNALTPRGHDTVEVEWRERQLPADLEVGSVSSDARCLAFREGIGGLSRLPSHYPPKVQQNLEMVSDF